MRSSFGKGLVVAAGLGILLALPRTTAAAPRTANGHASAALIVQLLTVNADNDAYGTGFRTDLTVPAPGVLANDEAINVPSGTIVTIQVTSPPLNGDLKNPNDDVNDDGSFNYEPDFNFCGTDELIYALSYDPPGPGNTLSEPARVEITVDCPTVKAFDDMYGPLPYNPSGYDIPAPGILTNDIFPPFADPQLSTFASPPGGSIGLHPDGSFRFAPITFVCGDYVWEYSLRFESSGTGDTVIDRGTVTVNVKCPPPPTPTRTPTATPTRTPTSSPTSTPFPTQTATSSPLASQTATTTPTMAPATSTPIPVTSASITPDRRTVNSNLHYTLTGYPANAPVDISWRRLSGSIIEIGTVSTDSSGATTSSFKVPATPGGPGQLITFKSGLVSRTVTFEVAPRIKVIYPDDSAERGQVVDVSLRGYAKNESVRIRWQDGDGVGWVTLATVVTSNTGSANVLLPVPSFAPDGLNSVRGDGTVFRQQTNVVNIQGGPGPNAPVTSSNGANNLPAGELPHELAFFALPIASVGIYASRRMLKKSVN